MATKPQQIAYTLTIDEDRDKLLSALINFAKHCGEMDHLTHHLRDENLVDVYKDFVKEKSDKSHLLKWCDNPDCDEK